MISRSKAFTGVAAALLLILLHLSAPVAAQAGDDQESDDLSNEFGIDPGGGDAPGSRSRFNYTLRPGQTFRDSVDVKNTGDVPVTLDLYATDAFNTPLDAGFALLQFDEEPIDVGTWVELGESRITVAPQTQAEVFFRITIPLDARPGDHVGAIVAQEVEPDEPVEPTDDVTIRTRLRIGTRLYVRVDGPLEPELQVTRIDFERSSALFPPFSGNGDATITWEIKNVGNTVIDMMSQLKIKGLIPGSGITFDEVEVGEVLPGSSVRLNQSFSNLPAFNRLTAEVTASGGDPVAGFVSTTSTKSAWIVSWGWALVLLVLIVIYTGVRLWRRRNAAGEPTEGEPTVEDATGAVPS